METPAAADVEAVSTARDTSGDGFYKIVHLDAGRKYFSPDNIKAIIDNAAAAGFEQVELYLSDNQGFRFALEDMTITTSYGTYDLTPALGDGYEDFEIPADDCNCTGHFGVDTFCLALHGADLHIWSGAWSAQHGNCSAWCGCAYYLFPAEWCDFAGYGIFD